MALLAFGACDEAVAPPGESAAVDVRVYLDRDASGAFSAADSGLAGVILSLSSSDGTTSDMQATSDNQGIATFPEVAPGAYTVTLPAAAPAGTVLSTSAAPRVVVSAIGQVQAPEIRYSWIPGRITGRVFRDDDASGAFNAGDTPGAGLYVVLSRAGARVDSIVADADGAYTFPFVSPGSYTVRVENPGTIVYPDGATRTITVAAGATNTITNIFTGALVIPIAEARARPLTSTVAVIGNLVVRPGRFPSGASSELWVQDATGGIAAFPVPTADSALYQLGDRLEISGARSAFSQQSQITISRITNLGAGTVPVPVPQTVSQINAFTRDGQLVRVANVTITSIPTGTGAAFTVLAADAGGEVLQLRIAGAGAGLSRASFVVGNRYTITGVATRFNATAQIKIRDAGDVELGAAITPIATVRSSGVNGTSYTVAGRITAAPGMITSGTNNVNSELWVQDATGGIAVFSVPTADTATLALGNTVEVTGARGGFSGQLQLGTPVVTRTGNGSPVTPVVQSITEAIARTLEGQVVTVSGFTVTAVQTGTSAAFNVNGTVDGQPFLVRSAAPLRGLTRASFTVGSTYTVTGILTQFNGTAQLKVRSASDVTP
jgi:DNA/RNA endonuclease YhcR with UshA esterase domain